MCSNLLFTCDTCCRFLSPLRDRCIMPGIKGTLLPSQTKRICWAQCLLSGHRICTVYTHNSTQEPVIDRDQSEYLPACSIWWSRQGYAAFIQHNGAVCVHVHWTTRTGPDLKPKSVPPDFCLRWQSGRHSWRIRSVSIISIRRGWIEWIYFHLRQHEDLHVLVQTTLQRHFWE